MGGHARDTKQTPTGRSAKSIVSLEMTSDFDSQWDILQSLPGLRVDSKYHGW